MFGVNKMSKKLIKLKPIKAIRLLTGIIDPKNSITILGLVNLLARHLDKCDILETEFLLETFRKSGIELDLSDSQQWD